MIAIAALWILILLAGGGFALDRVLTSAVTRNFDDQLDYVLTSLITSAEIGPEGEVMFNREPADQRFLEPYSGLYWQVSAPGKEAFPSRSLWDRRLAYGSKHSDLEVHVYDSSQFKDEKLRVARTRREAAGIDGALALPSRAESRRPGCADQRAAADVGAQLPVARVGADRVAGLQTWYGLRPLRRFAPKSRGCAAGARGGSKARCPPKSRRWSRNSTR